MRTAPEYIQCEARRRDVVMRLLSPTSVLVAWAVVLIACIHPPHETGIGVCWLHASTGVQCPGCGLIRSFSCGAHGLFGRSWSYHPFGLPLLVVFAGIAIVGISPTMLRDRVVQLLQRHAHLVHIGYVAILGAFVIFGVVRAVRSLDIDGMHANRHSAVGRISTLDG